MRRLAHAPHDDPASLRRYLLWGVAALLIAYFAYEGAGLVRDYYHYIKADYDTRYAGLRPNNDFPMFYVGAHTVVSADRAQTYDRTSIERKILALDGHTPESVQGQWYVRWLRYYNPPFFLLLLAPITLLEVHTAYLIIVALNFVAIAALAYLTGRMLRWQQPVTAVAIAGMLTFRPVYFALQHAQPTLLLAILFVLAFLASESGRRFAGAGLLALMGLKPQWVVLPGLAMLRKDPKGLPTMLGAGVLILLVPFVVIRPGALADYVSLILSRGEGDLSDANYSSALLSWAGFFRALTGSPQPVATLLFGLVTLAAFFVVLMRKDARLTWAASALVTLIVVPHSHPQDWVMVIPAAALLLSRPTSPALAAVTALGLLAIYLGANDWPAAQKGLDDDGKSLYWVTPAAAFVIAWIVALPWVEERLERRRRDTAAVLTRQGSPAA